MILLNQLKNQFLHFAQIDGSGIDLPKPATTGAQVEAVLSVVFKVAGAVAVLVIIIAGISYIISAGDPQKTAKAKDAILYAVIGLVVALLASVIVSYTLGRTV